MGLHSSLFDKFNRPVHPKQLAYYYGDQLDSILLLIKILMEHISTLLLIQVTTARKAVTLLLSYIIFTKPLSGQHCTGLLLISMGIIFKMLPDQCQQKIISIHSYSPLITEASTSRSDPVEGISKLEEGHEEIKRHLSD